MSDTSKFQDSSHVRLNILTNEWILVSPHRAKRPWSGQIEASNRPDNSGKDEVMRNNPLAPGSLRNGRHNPMYEETYAFDNDFPALTPHLPSPDITSGSSATTAGDEGSREDNDKDDEDLFQSKAATGRCRVICFHPNPKLSLPLMSVDEIDRVIVKWQIELQEMSKDFVYVQIFENKGELMGCSNPHPHCQVWATSFLPNEIVKENNCQEQYFKRKNKVLLEEYRDRELFTADNCKDQRNNRVVLENDNWLVLVPFWATWPFETLLLPKWRVRKLTEVDSSKRKSLAEIIKILTTIYDNLFETSFPYSMGWHGAPDSCCSAGWLLHAHYYPCLLRSKSIKKFMVGYELLAQAQRDITAEEAAERLRGCSRQHYSLKKEII